MAKTLEKTEHIKAKNIFRLVNQMWENMEENDKTGWKAYGFDTNKEYTEAEIFYHKTVE